ncbi:hypothetical protein ONZ43_g4425 [Nemania bipapillata]|uniref:Uncharacterized protein n=1 Tax=Nemania bipapillata TaxID=110536 RepID=A0ACC2IN37_9PEZI|nr:hypothetical protein ONZ43_g4425 [Nemania bipapillata]
MEHLLASTGSAPINIPYVGIVEFEAHGDPMPDNSLMNFKSSWMLRGWNVDQATGDLIFDGRSPVDVVRALQTTLYFGCIISVFRRVGITVRTRDFVDSSTANHIDGVVFIRTRKLHGLIAEWIQREGLADGPAVQNWNDPKYMRGLEIKEMLNWTFWYLGMFCKQSDAMPAPWRDQAKLVELSIMAMGESLCSVFVAVYGYEHKDMPTWGPSPVLKDRLRDNGWCPSDSPFFPESMTRAAVSADYYFGSFCCPRRRDDHRTCSTAICNEYLKVVVPGQYKQQHAEGQNCSCAPVRVSEDVIKLVAGGDIPVVQWDGEALMVSAGRAQSRYVAMSHVWSDGLGNDEVSNAMLRCQLSRIQSLVNKLYPEVTNENVPFWIDTLCVPVGKTHRELRSRAIRQMSEIYRVADRVLVLDSFILPLSRSASIVANSLVLSTDPDKPGLGVDRWVSNGTDMIPVAVRYTLNYNVTGPSIRLFPTGLETSTGTGPDRGDSMFSTNCGTWVSQTVAVYADYPLDQFVFTVGEDGVAESVVPLALRTPLVRER